MGWTTGIGWNVRAMKHNKVNDGRMSCEKTEDGVMRNQGCLG